MEESTIGSSSDSEHKRQRFSLSFSQRTSLTLIRKGPSLGAATGRKTGALTKERDGERWSQRHSIECHLDTVEWDTQSAEGDKKPRFHLRLLPRQLRRWPMGEPLKEEHVSSWRSLLILLRGENDWKNNWESSYRLPSFERFAEH